MTYFACVVLFRYCLPLCILIASVIRPSLLSAAYCILLFITPLIPVPTKKTMEGITATFLKCVMGISVLGAALHGAFHVIIALQSKGYDGTLTNCTSDEILFRNLGFVTFGNNIQIETAILRVAPEAIMVIVSIGFFILFKRLTQAGIPTLMESMESAESPENAEEDLKFFKKYSNIFLQMGRHLVLTLFCIASISKPSIPGALYFLIYFGTATWWACCKPLQRMFGLFLCGLSPFVLLNILVLYFYQSEYFSDFVPTDSLGARLSGLTILTETGCHGSNFTGDPRQIVYNAPWPFYVHAVTLFILFHIMVLLGKELLLPEEKTSDTNLEQEESPLIRGNSPSKRYGSVRKSILSGKGSEDIPMDSMSEGESSVSAPSIMDNIIFILVAIINAVVTVSYLGTNIIMMAWSITFTCWISFVLLIWANLMWLVPHQRKAMLRSSPYLLAYVFCVLAAIYVLSLDLTPSELPRDFKGVNMKEIGLEKEDFKNMAIKCIFTVMFFITLRQYMQERIIEKQTSAIADMVAPLQVTVGAATSGAEAEKTPGVKIMDKLGALIVNFLTKFWIWVVAAMLFAVAITGQRMTGFRIVYMALFLIFLLTFQLSFKIWRKMMFAFWLIVILFSMIVLVATYTYQFDNFSSYWTDYLHIDKEQQLDIGLQVFETKQLFVRLLTPTSFVIISVIQLHYFHKDFMKLSDPNSSGEKVEENVDVDKEMNESSLQGGAYSDKSVKDDTTTESGKYEFSELKDFKHKKKFENFLRQFDHFKNKLFIFLEIHMLKLVLFFAMILCVEDKCAVYSSIIILITLSFLFGRPMQLFAVYTTSVIVSLMLLGRMLYQIKYVTPSNWDVNCTEPKGNTTEIVTKNNGPWFGFVKTDSLSEHVKWNIIYLLVVTLWSIVQVRQYYHRLSRGQSTLRAFFMFPNIKRADAEKNLTNMLKYLANYGFFKFGLEFSLIILVGYIGIRMDAYALIQACWLMLMFFMSRKRLAKIWVFYLIFTALTLPIQYFMVLALPPSMCIIYPWNDSSVYLRLQEWAFLLNDTPPLPARKLIFDFILLLAISRQWVVFRIEKRYAGKNYAGGHNDSIIHLADREDFENPVPDFVTYVRSYLDIAKRVVLLSWFWITLALGFLAGTNRVNIFSLGYLMGAFYFLWQGTDIYLRPIKRILKAWNCFIFFNVTVIFLKTVFQIIGCVYVEKVAHDACWVMYLFGIGCVRKFGDIETNTDMEEQHECEMKNEFLGLFWDAMCFAFLIMQRRLFNSFNFLRIIDDTKAGTILASRGAELMEEMRIKRMHEQINTEQNVLKKIKLKMDRIKATQQKMQETLLKTTGRKRREPETFKEAIRSGDYYMFEDMDIEEIDILPEQTEKDEDRPPSDIPTLGEFMHDTVQTDIDTVVRQRKKSWKRRKTMPLTRSKTTRSTMSAPPAGGVATTKSSSTPRSVTIRESDIKPGTSQDEEDDILSDISESELSGKKESLVAKGMKYWYFVWAFVESAMLSLTNFYSKYTRDYRYVMKVLGQEKKILKERTKYNIGKRVGTEQLWQPSGTYHELLGQSANGKKHKDKDSQDDEMSQYDQPVFMRLLLAHWYLVLRHSEVLCYFMIFLNQAQTATFLSIPLPIMVFFWGTLTIPRPSKTFWVTIIAYTEVTVLIKCLFQLDIIPWNDEIVINNPFFPPKVIGIERKENYALYDLVLLLVVFFHRMLLKNMGIWTTVNVSLPQTPHKEKDYELVDGQLVSAEDNTVPKSKSDEDDVSLKSEEVHRYRYYAKSLQLSVSKYAETFKYFSKQLLDPTARVVADVYTYMFLCDFTNFFVLIFGFSSFGGQQYGNVSTFVKENKIPPLFLFMLMLQFFLIIVDRGIYLRKNIVGKIIFQIIQVLFLHIWLFVLFPILTEKEFTKEVPPQVFYFIKCIYFLLSAYQIRCGYPTRTLGNFLCKGFGIVNLVGFKAYILCPFVFELRAIMDWMWTETSMGVFDWLKMEDIFSHIFQIKCSRQLEEDYPQKRGTKKGYLVKYTLGGFLLLFIVIIIWLPLILFSMVGSVGVSNAPTDITIELRIGQYPPIYHMSAQGNALYQFNSLDFSKFQQVFNKQKKALEVLSYYTPEDTVAAQLSIDSSSLWLISPPDREKMVEEVKSEKSLNIRFDFQVTKKAAAEGESATLKNHIDVAIPPSTKNRPNENRENLLKMLQSADTSNITAVNIPFIFPKFLKVTNQGDLESAGPFMQMFSSNNELEREYRNLTLSLLKTTGVVTQEWWHVTECNRMSEKEDKNYKYFLEHLPYSDCDKLVIYTFNDRIFPDTLSIVTAGGIIGVYGSIVYILSRVLRGMFAEQVFKILYEDLPNVDRIVQLCLDVYLVREAREFMLEEDLFAKLIFLFRSPETLIKWTRPPEEIGDEDEDAED